MSDKPDLGHCCEQCKASRGKPCPVCLANVDEPCRSVGHRIEKPERITHLARRIAHGQVST